MKLTPLEIITEAICLNIGAIYADARGYEIAASDVVANLNAAGYAIVPKEPTEEMIHAYWLQLGLPKEAWTAMLAAFTKEQS